MSATSTRFCWWIPVGALVITLAYLPTLAAPFDFIDDGNLVYPAPGVTTLQEHAELWWQQVVANVEHLGPFRPTLWMHWHIQANLFGGDAHTWRAYRLLWCLLSVVLLLWLLHELRIPASAAIFASAAAMWNPYRSEIWTSLTLSEGVAMPYALFALIAARKAASSNRALAWDFAGFVSILIALGCKNTFAAVVPAQLALRMLPDGVSLRLALRRHAIRGALLACSLLLPAGHFVYFKLNWHPGQYQPGGPSVEQFFRVLAGIKGGMGMDFLGAGIAAAIVIAARNRSILSEYRAAIVTGASLSCVGIAIYLPMDAMSGRYTMPGIWGMDIFFALLLTALLRAPVGYGRATAITLICVGLAAVLTANLVRQDKIATRARMLWEVVHHLETAAPPGATVAWVSGNALRGDLDAEEGIHVQWHLERRGRGDVRIVLIDSRGERLNRVELPPGGNEPLLRVSGTAAVQEPYWTEVATYSTVYQFGRKRYDCYILRRSQP